MELAHEFGMLGRLGRGGGGGGAGRGGPPAGWGRLVRAGGGGGGGGGGGRLGRPLPGLDQDDSPQTPARLRVALLAGQGLQETFGLELLDSGLELGLDLA